MIHRLLARWRDRHFNRGTKQLRDFVTATNARETKRRGELLLTTEHMLAYIDAKLAARRLMRPDRQAAALKGVRTKRGARA